MVRFVQLVLEIGPALTLTTHPPPQKTRRAGLRWILIWQRWSDDPGNSPTDELQRHSLPSACWEEEVGWQDARREADELGWRLAHSIFFLFSCVVKAQPDQLTPL